MTQDYLTRSGPQNAVIDRWRRGLWLGGTLASFAVAAYALHYLLPRPFTPPNIAANPRVHPWLIVHAGFGAVALLLGPFQLLARWRASRPAVHRWLGRAYVLSCLVAGAAGLILAPGSSAGPIASAGFAVLAVLWLGATTAGWSFARQRRLAQHRAWMLRSFALTFAAVTLRAELAAAAAWGLPMLAAYRAIAWLSWAPNLLLAEIYLRRVRRPKAALIRQPGRQQA